MADSTDRLVELMSDMLEEQRLMRHELKEHTERSDRRFEQVDNRFEQVDKRFESILTFLISYQNTLNRHQDSLDLLVNAVTGLRRDLAQVQNDKLIRLEDRLAKVEAVIFRQGA